MATSGDKDPDALKTIGELSTELGVAQHILRYWETRFSQLKPMQRAGNRRYYRPGDVALVRRINRLLNEEGYTVKGVQKLLRQKGDRDAPIAAPDSTGPEDRMNAPLEIATVAAEVAPTPPVPPVDVFQLIAIRDRLKSLISD